MGGLQGVGCRVLRGADCRGLRGAGCRGLRGGMLPEVDMLPCHCKKGVGHPAARWRDEGAGLVEVVLGKLQGKVLGWHSFAAEWW